MPTRPPSCNGTEPNAMRLRSIDCWPGETVDERNLAFPIEGYWHLALVVTGTRATDALEDFARSLNRRLLAVPQITGVLWCWVSGTHPFSADQRQAVLAWQPPAMLRVALGRDRYGPAGFQRTLADDRVADRFRHPDSVVGRHCDVAVEELLLGDSSAAQRFSLDELGPLVEDDRRAYRLRETLALYLDTNLNKAACPRVLEVHEQTIANRLAEIERLLGVDVRTRLPELAAALRIVGRTSMAGETVAPSTDAAVTGSAVG